ncbi:MAG: hypothetical protein DMG58_25880 [Acidobacteria bacterium]|nr:MAG: hypothetical protein DMG58_25880 [Acidobacteriota bacterium]
MLLSFVPSNVKPGAPPPPKFGTLVLEANTAGVEVFVDGKSVGVISKGAPLSLPGLVPGVHTIKGVKMGYEPDGPREEMVYPGQETTVSIKILIAKRRSKAAVDALDKGMEYYTKGFADNYRKAATYFEKAIEIDPSYSQAALYLGRTYKKTKPKRISAKPSRSIRITRKRMRASRECCWIPATWMSRFAS